MQTLALTQANNNSLAARHLSTLGLQLYTLRDSMAVKPAATLRAVKDAGYTQVELRDVNDADVAEVHLKDVQKGTPTIFDKGKVPKDAFKEVGSGELAIARLIKTAIDIGVAHCHLGQDLAMSGRISLQIPYKVLRQAHAT